MATLKEKRASVHYVNNKEFSQAVVDYVRSVNEAKEAGKEPGIIPNYVGMCFLKICEGLSHKYNFINYTYRDEMVMDAVENCVKAITNYDVNKATRTGLPNAFAYFTQISYFAFLRRIAKEKKQADIKVLYAEHSGSNAFADFGSDSDHTGEGMIERIRTKNDTFFKGDKAAGVEDKEAHKNQFGKPRKSAVQKRAILDENGEELLVTKKQLTIIESFFID
jgi:hypothetical protein